MTVAQRASRRLGGSTTDPRRRRHRGGGRDVPAAVDSSLGSKLVEKRLGHGPPEKRVDVFAEIRHFPADGGEVEVLRLGRVVVQVEHPGWFSCGFDARVIGGSSWKPAPPTTQLRQIIELKERVGERMNDIDPAKRSLVASNAQNLRTHERAQSSELVASDPVHIPDTDPVADVGMQPALKSVKDHGEPG